MKTQAKIRTLEAGERVRVRFNHPTNPGVFGNDDPWDFETTGTVIVVTSVDCIEDGCLVIQDDPNEHSAHPESTPRSIRLDDIVSVKVLG